jgi:L-fucose isomerase-like protein
MFVGMRDLMAENNAQGIAIDCLRFFYSGNMAAYPCLGFCQLNDDGYVGACEADLASAISMLALSYVTGRPGYISDPVVDTAKKQVIYAHCVAPTKVFGPKGTRNPYHIRSHSEDRKGASIRSLLPLNEMTTTMKFVPEQKLMVIHQGRTVANIDDDKACRTKVAVDFQNARKLFNGWQFGWHRVTVYGDYKDRLEDFSRLMGFKVVEEGA